MTYLKTCLNVLILTLIARNWFWSNKGSKELFVKVFFVIVPHLSNHDQAKGSEGDESVVFNFIDQVLE